MRSLPWLLALSLTAACDGGGDDAPDDGDDGDAPPTVDGGASGSDAGGPGGPCSWSHHFGGSSADVALGVVAMPDGGVVVVGYTRSYNGDLAGLNPTVDTLGVVLRFDAAGQRVWTKLLAPGTRLEAVTRAASGELVVAGLVDQAGACANYHGAEDAYLARLDAATGEVLEATCIGGDDDDEARAVVTETGPDGLVVRVVGGSDSDGDGNVGDKHGGGGVDSPDVLYGVWSATQDFTPGERAHGWLFGSNGPEVGVAFLGDGLLAGNTFGDSSGDLVGTTHEGYADIWFPMLPVAPATCTLGACLGGVVRTGGDSNDQIGAGIAGGWVVGSTRSVTGPLACPHPDTDLVQAWIGRVDRAQGLVHHGCFGGDGDDEPRGLVADGDDLFVVGSTSSSDGDFAGATMILDDAAGEGGFIARYASPSAAPVWTARAVRSGGVVIGFDDVTVTTDGCIVAVGRDDLDLYVQAHPR